MSVTFSLQIMYCYVYYIVVGRWLWRQTFESLKWWWTEEHSVICNIDRLCVGEAT